MIWRVGGQQMQNFHPWIWPLGFYGSESSTWHHHMRHLAGRGGLIPVFIFLLPPKLYGLCKSHLSWLAMRLVEKQRLARAAHAAGGQCGNPAVMPAVRLQPGTSSCRQTRDNGEMGLVPRELPLKHVPWEHVPISQEGLVGVRPEETTKLGRGMEHLS